VFEKRVIVERLLLAIEDFFVIDQPELFHVQHSKFLVMEIERKTNQLIVGPRFA
jgi:hypothetical protein